MTETRRVICWRHGQTDWNIENRFQGQRDVPLNETGLAQAERAARLLAQLRPDAIVASDLQRAADTARALARIVGLRRATELMMTNRTLSAAEACEWQIVNRVYPAADFGRNVATLPADLPAGPTHLQAMAKERFHAGWRQPIEECTELEIQNVMRSVRHPHFRPVLESFLKKETRGDAVQARLP